MANPEDYSPGKPRETAEDIDFNGGKESGRRVVDDVREGISQFVGGVKDKISGEKVRRVGEAASQVKDQVRDYIEDRGMTGLRDDVTNVIRRYPIPALLCGVLIGVLLARPRGE